MENQSLSVIIGGAIIAICVIIAIVVRIRKSKDIDGKEEAKKFLEELENLIYTQIINIINTFDITKYQTIEDMESDILNTIFSEVWNFIEAKLEQASKEDLLSAVALKFLNKEFVYEFIQKILDQYKIMENLDEQYKANAISLMESEMLKEDKELAIQFSNTEEYNVEEISHKEISEEYREEDGKTVIAENDIPGRIALIEEKLQDDTISKMEKSLLETELKALKNLKPQRDDEEAYDPNDTSMEIVEE